MKRATSRPIGLAAGLALAAVLVAFPASMLATTNEPIAQTGGMTATLPLFGTTLTVDVTLDALGNISGVALSGTPAGTLTGTSSSPTLVKFSNADGSTKVSVKARESKMSISARSKQLADFLGSGTWSADVFGTGTKSTVDYTIGDDGSGNPTLTIGAISTPSSPAGITSSIIPVKAETEKDEASASGGVTFSFNGFEKKLRISVEVDKEDGGHASLKFTLTGKDRQLLSGTLDALSAVASRTWAAHLCNGTAVAVAYHVAADGTIVFDAATGATATEKATDGGISVRFDGTNVGVRISLKDNGDGTFTLSVKGTSGNCEKGDHSASSEGDHKGSSEGDHSASSEGDHKGSSEGDSGHP